MSAFDLEPRLKSDVRVQALVRQCTVLNAAVYVLHKGDVDAGTILLKHNRFGKGCALFSQTRTDEGATAWLKVAEGEAACDAHIAREQDFDPDVWAIEVEDLDDVYQLDAPVIS